MCLRQKSFRTICAVLALAFSSSAYAGHTVQQGGPGKLSRVEPGGGVVFSATFSTTGALIPDDANTVAHVYWDGTQLVDTKGNAWTQNGTVPKAPGASPLYPHGATRPAQGNAGPFSASNYYSFGLGSESMDFTGDFYACVIFNGTSNATQWQGLVQDGADTVGGWKLGMFGSAQTVKIETSKSGSDVSIATTNTVTVGQANVVCGGRGGSTEYVKLNLGSIVSGAAASPITQDATDPAQIGYGATANAFQSYIVEVLVVQATPSDSVFTALQGAALSSAAGGPYFTEPAGTVSHVYWNGTALVDTKGLAWTQNGTVPQGSAAITYSYGVDLLPRSGAGPFSNTNNYQLGTGTDALDFGGDFEFFAAWVAKPGTDHPLVNAGRLNTSGWQLYLGGAGAQPILDNEFSGGEDHIFYTSGVTVVNGINVACGGRAGNTIHLNVNFVGDQTAPVTSIVRDTADPSFIGAMNGSATTTPDNVLEFWASATTPTASDCIAKMQQYLGLYSDNGVAMSFSRASTATDVINGHLWYWPLAVPRIGPSGYLSEGASTNLILQSEALDNASWTKTTDVVTANAATAPDGNLTAERIQHTGGSGNVAQANIAVTASAKYTFSFWAKNNGGAGADYSVTDVTHGTDIITHTSYVSQINGGSWTRVQVSFTTPAGCVAVNVYVQRDAVSSSDLFVWGVQLEQQSFATSYVATTTATVTRSADALTATNPLPASRFCANVQTNPIGAWNRTASYDPFVVGNTTGSNSGRFVVSSSNILLQFTDNSGTARNASLVTPTSGSHSLTGCFDGALVHGYLDGVLGTDSASGLGTIVQPATITIGSGADGALNGYVSKVKLCKTGVATRCQ